MEIQYGRFSRRWMSGYTVLFIGDGAVLCADGDRGQCVDDEIYSPTMTRTTTHLGGGGDQEQEPESKDVPHDKA